MEVYAQIDAAIERYVRQVNQALEALSGARIADFIAVLARARLNGQKVFVFGNGGSASTASHMVADLAKNTQIGGLPRFRVISLTDNVARLTALANDGRYDDVFAEQLQNLASPKDVAVAVSASGNSPNVLAAVRVARELGLYTIGLIGFGGGILSTMVDLPIVVESSEYGPVEDVHLIICHLVTVLMRELDADSQIALGLADTLALPRVFVPLANSRW